MRIGFISAKRESLPAGVIPLGLLSGIASTSPEVFERSRWYGNGG